MLDDIFKPLTKLFGVAPRSRSLRLWPDTLFRPRTIYARTKRRMQNGLNDVPVLVHEPARAKLLSSYEPRFAPNFRTNHNDVRRPRDQTLSVVVQVAVNNLAERLCSSKISGLRVEAPWHCLIMGRSALRQQWAAPPIQRNRYANLEFAIVWAKIIFAKFPTKKRRIVPTGNVGERLLTCASASHLPDFYRKTQFRWCY